MMQDNFSNQEDIENAISELDTDHGLISITQTSNGARNMPAGVALFGSFIKFNTVSARRTFHKALVLCITFIAYSAFHMGRRPLSIVKNVLNRNCSQVHLDNVHQLSSLQNLTVLKYDLVADHEDPNWCDWAPFNDDKTANRLLALLDSAFLFSYAFFMFFSGFLADRCNLRYYFSAGTIISGVLLYAFGVARYLDIHSMSYFIIIQILTGAVQTTGWPSVVTCIGNWFDSSSRGSIFGLWNANTNFGNILGATIAGAFAERDWGLSFIVPGFIMMLTGVVIFLFLVPKPEDVGLPTNKRTTDLKTDRLSNHSGDQESEEVITTSTPINNKVTGRRKLVRVGPDSTLSELGDNHSNNSEQSPLIINNSDPEDICATKVSAASFWACLRIPGVVEYSVCLGFAKLVSYTFLYWLPRYITQTSFKNSEDSAYLSVPFDIGGVFGAIIAGFLSDKYKKTASICSVMLLLAIPAMLIFENLAASSNLHNIVLQLLVGALVTGPYALITTAVSADLGSRIKDGKAMATVAAIIDGTGSIGAAIGPLFAGFISESGWETVFIMLMTSDLIAALCLIRITLKEVGLRPS